MFKDVLRQPVVCGEGEEAVGEDPVVCQPDPRDLRSWGVSRLIQLRRETVTRTMVGVVIVVKTR